MASSPHYSFFPAANPRFTHASRFKIPLNSILLALLCFLSTACSMTALPGKIFFEDSRGTLSLQTIPDRSIQANHPIDLNPALLAQVLEGMEVQDQTSGIQRLIAGPATPAPVFSAEQIRFLAPLLAEGLRRAIPDESVTFRVQANYEGSLLETSATETTTGSLYAYGRQLYITLSQYRYSPNRVNQNVGRSGSHPKPPDFSGLRDRILLFTPKAAQRSDDFDPPAGGKPTDRFLAIDYELLQQAPTVPQTAPQVERVAPMPSSQAGAKAPEATSPTTEALAQEVETLRKELKSVQERLGSQPTKPDSLKRKPTPQKK